MTDVKSQSRSRTTVGAEGSRGPKKYDHVVSHFRYSEADVLGEGAYGSVYKAYDEDARATAAASSEGSGGSSNEKDGALPANLRGCRVVALKQMSSAKPEDGVAAATLREIAILKELSHMLRSDQRQSSITRLGGYATYAANPSAECEAAAGARGTLGAGFSLGCLISARPNKAGEGDTAELSLTDQGNTSEAADDCNGQQSTPSPVPSPGIYGNAGGGGVLSEKDYSALLAEGRRYVLDLLDVVVEGKSGKVFLALEYCEAGDAWHYLRGTSARRITHPRVLRRWVREMILGVAFMHSKHISHRDLKSQNIMLKRRAPRHPGRATSPSSNREAPSGANGGKSGKEGSSKDAAEGDDEVIGDEYTLKVADFGLSRVEGIPVKKYVHEAVTLWYRSPDIILGNTNYSCSVDAWSLGCIIIEFASGAAPFRGKDETEQLKRILTRLGGLPRRDLPSVMDYPHSETYKPVLESLVLFHEKEKEGNAFAEKDTYELKTLLSKVASTGPLSSSQQALLEHVAVNKARLRLLLESRNGGMQVLGEDGLDLVARLLIVDPKKRLSVLEAVRHPFMLACLADDREDDKAASRTPSSEAHSLQQGVDDRGPIGVASREAAAVAFQRPQHNNPQNASGGNDVIAESNAVMWPSFTSPSVRLHQQQPLGTASRGGPATARAASTAASQQNLPNSGNPRCRDDGEGQAGVSLPALSSSATKLGNGHPERAAVMVGPPVGFRSRNDSIAREHLGNSTERLKNGSVGRCGSTTGGDSAR